MRAAHEGQSTPSPAACPNALMLGKEAIILSQVPLELDFGEVRRTPLTACHSSLHQNIFLEANSKTRNGLTNNRNHPTRTQVKRSRKVERLQDAPDGAAVRRHGDVGRPRSILFKEGRHGLG